MQQKDLAINFLKQEELLYWAKKLKVAPLQLIYAARVTGSNLLSRMIYYLKAEGLLPFHFNVDQIMYPR